MCSLPVVSRLVHLAQRASVAVVTGAAGFAGTHLVREILASTCWNVVGLVRHTPNQMPRDRYIEVAADIRDQGRLRQILAEARPDYIFHLAAATPPSHDEEMFLTNVGGTTALLESALAECPQARLLIVGSDAQYGPLEARDLPTPETASMHPVGAYGRSKALQEEIALRYWRMADLQVVCVRPFNHIGPGQSDRFVVGSLTSQIAMIEAGLESGPLQIGDTHAARDFTDVRDVVRAYVLGIALGELGSVYNIGTGMPRTVAEIAEVLLGAARLPIAVQKVPMRVRVGEVSVTQCDSSRFRRDTGWAPIIPIEQTALDTLNYWRAVAADGDIKLTTPSRPRSELFV